MAANPTFCPLENLPVGHEWTGTQDLKLLISDMFRYNPRLRPDASDVLVRIGNIATRNGIFGFTKHLA